MAAMNEIMLGVETYLAHLISGTIVPHEWIPIIFGPIAGVLLLVGRAARPAHGGAGRCIATLVFLASIVVGLLGAYFHLVRAAPACPGRGARLRFRCWCGRRPSWGR